MYMYVVLSNVLLYIHTYWLHIRRGLVVSVVVCTRSTPAFHAKFELGTDSGMCLLTVCQPCIYHYCNKALSEQKDKVISKPH